ncbi:MAG: hypothetical protein ABI072_07595 [Edaphobacter sp.]
MHPLAIFIPEHTQSTINTAVWIVSLALQLALFASLFARHIARQFPIFTSLIGFYLVRSALLFLIFDRIGPATYHALYGDLALIDLFVQTVVAVEILLHLVHASGSWTRRNALLTFAVIGAAALGTVLTTTLLPAHAPILTDRTQFFFSFLMILLFAWAIRIPTASNPVRRIAGGFALYGIVNVSANFGRTYAAIQNNVGLYATWSYALAAIYLVVVLFWLVTLKDRREPQTP